MALKRTTVFADEEDLAVLKAAAARRGIAEAELLRQAIHLVALAEQRWKEPFFSTAPLAVASEPARVADVLDEVWSQRADDYRRSKSRQR